MEPSFPEMEPRLHFGSRFTVHGSQFTVGPNGTYRTHVTHGTARVEAHEPPTANCLPLTANRQPLVLRLQSMVPEKIHEFLVVIRPDIEEDAHPTITTSGC
jgi:hypothetical protein